MNSYFYAPIFITGLKFDEKEVNTFILFIACNEP